MRIAQVSSLWERVPPPGYGGIELVVGYLCDELTRRGHEVTLFASGDSQTLATLHATVPTSFRTNPELREPGVYEILHMKAVMDHANEFDVIHFHNGYAALPVADVLSAQALHTLHGKFSQDNQHVFQAYGDHNYVTISNAQRMPGLDLNYIATVYNGIDPANYPFTETPSASPYLAFLGRLSPEKGPQNAIAVARATGMKLIMAGKVDKVDIDFYEQEIKPHIDGEQIQYLGETTHEQKIDLIGNAAVTLFPITWPEPFGLVMIESMCTGTPVLGMRHGSVPEVIKDGVAGYVCDSVEEMVKMLPEAIALDRRTCHQYVLDNFSISSMVSGYEAVYEHICGGSVTPITPSEAKLTA